MIGEGNGAVRLVDTSGNTIQLDTSGRVTIAGGSITASISGDTVIAKISGAFVTSSGEARSISGNAVIFSGQGVWVSGSVSVSGNAVTSSGDTYIAKVSGETIRIASGAAGVVTIGNIGATSTAALNAISLDTYATANTGLHVLGSTLGFLEASGSWARMRVTASGTGGISGIGIKLIVDFSGSVATVSGNVVTVSGNAVNMAGAVVTAPTWLTITGASGGTTLTSQACTMVRLMNLSGNGTMLVGGTGTAAPVSGTKGIMLWPGSLSVQGTEMDFPVNNANLLAVVAHTSGNTLAYMTFG